MYEEAILNSIFEKTADHYDDQYNRLLRNPEPMRNMIEDMKKRNNFMKSQITEHNKKYEHFKQLNKDADKKLKELYDRI